MTDDEDSGGELTLVFPFIACTSNGGPYDDEAFVAGYQCGQIDIALAGVAALGGNRLERYVRSDLVGQVDLIAMNRGFSVASEPWVAHPGEWTRVLFRLRPPVDPPP